MATGSSPALRRGQAVRGNAGYSRGEGRVSPRRDRRGSVVHFDEVTSIYPAGIEADNSDPQHLQGTLRGEPTEEEYSGHDEDHSPSKRCCYSMSVLLEKPWVTQFFRICAVLNLLSLACSSPWRVCSGSSEEERGNCEGVFYQFVVIASVDFIVSIVYTVQLILVIQSVLFHRFWEKKGQHHQVVGVVEVVVDLVASRRRYLELITVLAITVSLWYSVAVGIYRSYIVREHIAEKYSGDSEVRMLESATDPVLHQTFYIAFFFRSLAAASALQLVRFKQQSAAVGGLIKIIKNRWKQLFYVSIFYFFNVYIFALVGVQVLGGLTDRCYYNDETGTPVLAIPTTHCSSSNASVDFKSCFSLLNNQAVSCMPLEEARATNLDYRDTVYLGQFRSIIDALFAVYEASSLELWSFMEYNGLSGSSRSIYAPVFFYFMMVFYLVIIVQQSIFLVVIIESFADLRSDSASEVSGRQQKKPTIVLYEQKGGTNEIGFKDIETQESLTAFKRKRNKFYYQRVEKFFIILVLVDAVVMCATHSGMSEELAEGLRYWQVGVSMVFVLEVVGLFVFHLVPVLQLALFFKNRYFWFLAVIAVGGLGGAVWWATNPLNAGNVMAIFQALRLIRVVRLFKVMKDFVSKIIGDSVRMLTVVLIVAIFLVSFAVVSMVLVGYLQPKPGCERIGSERFRDFFHSIESMFQLLMQEGWSQLYSEFQCRRDGWWVLINFYFIILHLIASLFLLNFFVAVILDNLDYDEEEKIVKLEEAEKNKEKIQKVPRHLQIFKLGGPKKIPLPKLSSVDAPNLTEADVRNFYNVGEVAELSAESLNERPPLPYDLASRRSSELSNLDLLTGDAVERKVGLSAHQGKYWGIQGILSQVRAFRRITRENEASRPGQTAGDFLGSKPQVDPSDSSTRSEYDEYRDKYRLFDRALFCLPPENWLRRICCAVLTRQLAPPTKPLVWDQIYRPKALLNALGYLLRSMFSVLPYFTWFMLLVTTLALIGEIRETTDDGKTGRTSEYHTYLFWIDLIFVVFTLAELIIKILAHGLFLNPHAAIQGLWDVLDWVMVLATLGVLLVYLVECEKQLELWVTVRNLPMWFRLLHFCRALRPLRLISLLSSMRHVLYELALGFKNFALAFVLLLLFMFMFASLGVQLFTGNGGMESFCNDPNVTVESDCRGEFEIAIVTSSQESLPVGNSTSDTLMLVPRVWYQYRRNFRFDNTFRAFITLFEVLTLEGWLDVRDLYRSMEDTVFENNKYAFYMFVYIHIFVFIGVNFVLQIFVGIVVNNFNEHKPDHSALLTVSQKRWTELLQRISLTRPIKEPPPPRNNKFRMVLYRIFTNVHYKNSITGLIMLNSLLYCFPWIDSSYTRALMSVSIVVTSFFFLEFLLKLLSFGLRGYFQSGRNKFDCLLSILGMTYVIVAIIYLTTGSPSIDNVADIALAFTVMKLFTILMKYGILLNLLRTVVSTVIRSRHLIGVLVSILLLYTFQGNLLFSNVRTGEAINFSFVTFNRFFSSLNLIIRVVTGEDWYTIFQDSLVQPPYCSDELGTCGPGVFAFFFYLSFYVMVSFIILNVIIAVLLENFSIFYNEDDTNLTHAVVKDFQHNWLFYDKNASGLISSDKIKLFLRMLKLNEFYTYGVNINGIRERQKSSLLLDSLLLREMAEELRRDQRQQQAGQSEVVHSIQTTEDKEHYIPFQEVLKMIAYRAEDISQRLVPHDLYVREEFENSVQYDVAEQCILKWIKKFVKPVIKQQEKTRRRTVSHNVYKPGRGGGDSLWPPLVTTTGADDEETRVDGYMDSSEDSEDDYDLQSELHSSSWKKVTSHSEEEGSGHLDSLQPLLQRHESMATTNAVDSKAPALAKSFQRLQSAQFVHFEPPQQQPHQQGSRGGAPSRDKWHEWFQMQKKWMDNVEEDPDNYFDDNL